MYINFLKYFVQLTKALDILATGDLKYPDHLRSLKLKTAILY